MITGSVEFSARLGYLVLHHCYHGVSESETLGVCKDNKFQVITNTLECL